ncbi:hypothetical protein [Bartonella sp. DGB1]|uniref:hypothetical protein n=1 Tax=Bartonella sp. DGB1 TaxID=3239807 RepID=UPI00352369AA
MIHGDKTALKQSMKKYLYIAKAVITAYSVALAKTFKLRQRDQQNKQDKEILKSIAICQR